ncbi:hypothetical protein LZ31DRAFT_375867 [Colletotrichum somersetense]|nr:hypothetical protein LZ31DRAFT_375867 [Colletotrichum somersetense]
MKQPSIGMRIPNLLPLDPLRPDITATVEKKPSTMRWRRLPAEIQLMILEEAVLLEVPKKQAKPDPAPLGWWKQPKREKPAWPSVCAEWRGFFERHNFASLRLTSENEIKTFNKICVKGSRIHLVRRVHLHVELRRYFAPEGKAD